MHTAIANREASRQMDREAARYYGVSINISISFIIIIIIIIIIIAVRMYQHRQLRPHFGHHWQTLISVQQFTLKSFISFIVETRGERAAETVDAKMYTSAVGKQTDLGSVCCGWMLVGVRLQDKKQKIETNGIFDQRCTKSISQKSAQKTASHSPSIQPLMVRVNQNLNIPHR